MFGHILRTENYFFLSLLKLNFSNEIFRAALCHRYEISPAEHSLSLTLITKKLLRADSV
jgi:hypothetical protein